RREDAVEHAEPAPANEAVIEGLVRPVILWRILPLQTMLDDVDDAADDTAIIDAWNTVGQGKMRLDPSHLALAQQKQITHHGLLLERFRFFPNPGGFPCRRF